MNIKCKLQQLSKSSMDGFFSLASAFTSIKQWSGQFSSPLIIINHLLQAWFFSLSVCNIVALFLSTINFAYAKQVASSRLIKFAGVCFLFYIKIWDYYSGFIYILSIFSFMMVALYVYDCCGNISQYFNNWKQQNRDLAVIFSFLGMFSTTLYILWQIFKNKQKPLIYEYSGIYLLILILIVVGNLLRRRSVIYALMGVLVINYLIAARYLLHKLTQYNPAYIQATKIPIQTIVYFMMALDAQKRERMATNSQTFTILFKTCASIAAFSLLNDVQFPLELFVGGIFLFGLIINR